jgi:hypothetical protein
MVESYEEYRASDPAAGIKIYGLISAVNHYLQPQ